MTGRSRACSRPRSSEASRGGCARPGGIGLRPGGNVSAGLRECSGSSPHDGYARRDGARVIVDDGLRPGNSLGKRLAKPIPEWLSSATGVPPSQWRAYTQRGNGRPFSGPSIPLPFARRTHAFTRFALWAMAGSAARASGRRPRRCPRHGARACPSRIGRSCCGGRQPRDQGLRTPADPHRRRRESAIWQPGGGLVRGAAPIQLGRPRNQPQGGRLLHRRRSRALPVLPHGQHLSLHL